VGIVRGNSGKAAMDSIYAIMERRTTADETTLRDKTAELEMRVKELDGWMLASAILAVCSLTGTGAWMITFLNSKVRAEELSVARAAEARRSQNELSLVLAGIGDGLYRLDKEGKITYLNNSAKQSLGYELEEAYGKSAHELFHYALPDGTHLPANTCPMIEVVTRGIAYSSRDTDYFIRKDGSFFPIRCISAPIYDGDNLLGAVVSFTDMSEARKSETIVALQHVVSNILADQGTSDETIRNVIAAVCEKISWDIGAFWRFHPESGDLELSSYYSGSTESLKEFYHDSEAIKLKAGEGLPGREIESGQGVWLMNVAEQPDFPRGEFARRAKLRTGVGFSILLGDKKLGIVEFFTGKDVERDEDLLAALVSIGQQIGQVLERKIQEEEIKRGQEVLRVSQERLELAIAGSQDGIWDYNLQQQTLYLSDRCLEILGFDKNSFDYTPKIWMERIHPDDYKAAMKATKDHLKLRIPFEVEYRILRNDDVYCWFNSRGQAIWNETGVATRFSGSLRDISERKESEKRISEFYSMVSHELRTPLTSIRGSLGLIEGGKAGEVPPKVLKLVAIGRTESERLIRLINDILDIKKIETGHFELDPESFDPEKLVMKTIDGISGMALDSGVKLESSISTKQHLYGDFDRIVQVLTNLISNAIKYSPKGKSVMIRVDDSADDSAEFMLRVSVTDQGPGIPEHKIHKLFGMFQQLDSSDSRKKGGTGLGLAISKSIVQQHGGTIGVESNVGEGSCFWFEIPVDRSYEVPTARERVLVVENNHRWFEVLSIAFPGSEFELSRARDVHEAQNELAKGKPAFIVFALDSSEGDGLEFLQRLRGTDTTSDIPVIVLGGGGADSNGSVILLDWLSKPFDPKQIKKSLEHALKEHKSFARVLIVEDDASTREVLRQQICALGLECIEACDGEEAIKLARKNKPDLLILDLGLPVADGFDVVDDLKMEPALHVPLIVYTNKDLTREEKKRLSLGLTNHLVKAKTSEEELLKCVKGLLNGILV
jgi:PAS domain S-box-containing protein